MYFKCFFILFLIIKLSESCEIIKYEHSNGQKINYYRIQSDNMTCNNEPIFKMLHKPYFIYKSKSGLWCDSYLQNELVNCDMECKDVRFQFVLNLTGKIIPELFDSRFQVWESKNSEAISCVENESFVPETPLKPEIDETPQLESLVLNQQKPKAFSFDKTKLPKKFRILRPIQNRTIVEKSQISLIGDNQVLLGNVQDKQNIPKEEPNLLVQSLTPNQLLSGASNVFPDGSQSNPQQVQPQNLEELKNKTEAVNNMLSVNPQLQVKSLPLRIQMELKPQIQPQPQPTNPQRLSLNAKKFSTNKHFMPASKQNYNIKQVLKAKKPALRNEIQDVATTEEETTTTTTTTTTVQMPTTTPIQQFSYVCPMLEFQIYDNTRVGYRINVPMMYGKSCKGYPIYKSSFGSYVYRNIYGDWCHDHLDKFNQDFHCLQPCTQKRLHPASIKSPVESTVVEVYNYPYQSKYIYNYRYVCAGMNCIQNGCLNNGTCMYMSSQFIRKAEYKCKCTVGFTGAFCETPLNPCLASPCMNGGSCTYNIGEPAECVCPIGFTGSKCELAA